MSSESGTPRTDAIPEPQRQSFGMLPNWVAELSYSEIHLRKLARTLERELAEARERAEMYEYVRCLNPRQFAELFDRNLKGEGAFDDLVKDALRHGGANEAKP